MSMQDTSGSHATPELKYQDLGEWEHYSLPKLERKLAAEAVGLT